MRYLLYTVTDRTKFYQEDAMTVQEAISNLNEAIKEDRSKVTTLLRSAGHNDLANSVEKL